jgi:1-acyl-sn-glycerol-3-phosphate acyltransferase
VNSWSYKPARDLNLKTRRRWASLDRESGLISTVLHQFWWLFVRTYLAIWHRLTITGREYLPTDAPLVLVANHTSHLDTLAMAAAIPWRLRGRLLPIAAGDVFFTTPVTSAFSAFMLNALPMWRKNCGSHALKQLRERLVGDPCVFILFPEGGRSRDGALMAFKPGLGMIVAGTNVPVVPCWLSGCFDAFPPGRRLPRRCRIRVEIGPPLNFAGVSNDRGGWQQITAETEAAVRRLRPGANAEAAERNA